MILHIEGDLICLFKFQEISQLITGADINSFIITEHSFATKNITHGKLAFHL